MVFTLEENPNPIEIRDGSNVFELMDVVDDATLIILAVGVPGIGKSTIIKKMQKELNLFDCDLIICDLDDRQSKTQEIPRIFRYFLPPPLYRHLRSKKIVDPGGSDRAMRSTWIYFCDAISRGSIQRNKHRKTAVVVADAGPNFWMRFQMITAAKLRAYTRHETFQELGLNMPEEKFHFHLMFVKGKRKGSWVSAFIRNLMRERIVHPKPFFHAVRGVNSAFREMLPYCDSWGIVENGWKNHPKDV